MSGKFSRFLRIERPRDGAAPKKAGLGTPGRFGAMEEQRPPAPEGGASGGEIERFRAPAATAESVGLDQGNSEDQPFARCAQCEADNGRFATRCVNCGADLETPDQREFNERLWARRREEMAQEKQDLAKLNQVRRQAEVEQREDQRKLGEAVAREAEARARMQWDERAGFDGTPLGLRLLRMIPDIRWRIAAVVGAVALPLLLLLLAPERSRARLVGSILLMVVFVFFMPANRYGRGRWGRWGRWN